MLGSSALMASTLGRSRRTCRSLELPKTRTRPSEIASETAEKEFVVLSQNSVSRSCMVSIRPRR